MGKDDKAKSSSDPTASTEEANAETEADGGEADKASREARALASIQERRRQVERALAPSMRDRDKEREYHKRDEAQQHFNALLADLVRNPELSWREAKKQLKKDHRYNLAELLTKDDKERLFTQHIQLLSEKRRSKLRALLDELNLPASAHWRDVKPQLKDDARTPKYHDPDKLEREFRDYQRDRQSNAKTSLRQLLLECKTITHKSYPQVKQSPEALIHIKETLKNDARFLALEHIPEERDTIIMGYIEEVHKKGPPPPPTATEPTRRNKP